MGEANAPQPPGPAPAADQETQIAAEEPTAATTAAITPSLQLDPRFFIRAPTGQFEFGEIAPEIGRQIGRESGPILLPRGNADYGALHITQQRLQQLRQQGFEDVPDYVHYVTSGYSQIYEGRAGRLLLVRKNGTNHLAAIELAPVQDGSGWTVTTAFPQSGKRTVPGKLVWDAGRSSASAASGEPVRYPDPAEQSPDQQDFGTTDQTNE